jgi:hypothetical protein
MFCLNLTITLNKLKLTIGMLLYFLIAVNLTIKSKFKIYAAVVSKLSKIFLALLSLPFYRGCKGKSLYFSNQNYLKKFQTFLVVKITLRTTVFSNGLQR